MNKNKETSENSAQKNSYEKLDKEANQLMQAAESLLQDGEDSLFEQAKANGNNQKVYDGIESFFEKYNSTLKALKNTSNTMNDFYRQMMLETSAEANIENLSSAYNANGSLYTAMGNGKIDIWG